MRIFKSILFFTLVLLFFANQQIFAQNPTINFYGSKAYGNGSPVYYGAQTGEFNGDGIIDLFTSNDSDVLIYPGKGNGEFLLPPIKAFSRDFRDIFPLTGDFNNDGHTDFAFADRIFDTISVVLTNSDGTFSAPILTKSEIDINSYITVGDFDNDKVLDVIVTGAISRDNAILFYKGNGNGTFDFLSQILTKSTVSNINLGDFNNDNLPDISYGESDNLNVIKNLGNGKFGEPVILGSISYGFAVSITADLNNEGFNDLAATQNSEYNTIVAVWLGNGDFTFRHGEDFQTPSFERIYLVQIADINNDQNQDLIFGGRNRVLISKGKGDGKFETARMYSDGGMGIAVADFNSDNWLDIASSQAIEFNVLGSGTLSVLLNQRNGDFISAPTLETGDGTQDIAIADFDNNQLKDIVVLNKTGGGGPGEIIIIFQTYEAELYSQTIQSEQKNTGLQALAEGVNANSVIAGDFNNDGKQDIIAVGRGAYGSNENVWMLTNLGGREFSQTFLKIGEGDIYDAAAADINADGKLDLIITGYKGVFMSLGLGNGNFASPVVYFESVPSSQIVIGDFNNDYKPDVAVVNYSINKIGILINKGSGLFANSFDLTANGGTTDIALSDMNFDGKLDLVIASGSGITIYESNGNGQFAIKDTYPVTLATLSKIAIADFSRDGKPDVAALTGSNTISVLTNDGTGGLNRETLWSGGAVLKTIAVADLNNDKTIDLIFGYTLSSGGFIKILFNLSDKQGTPNRTRFDFNGDGKTDISVFRPVSGGSAEWYYLRSSDGVDRGFPFGTSSDTPVPADFTGDGKTDIAFWRPSTGNWFVLRSEDSSFFAFPFGASGDIPAPGDFDGDGKADAAVFRPSIATWFILNSSDGSVTTRAFGANGDVPIVEDYDGDGKDDIAVYRPSVSEWYLQRSTAGFIGFRFGAPNDITPVPADYTGDGKADIAFFAKSTNQWFVLRSEDTSFYAFPFGAAGDIPTPGDYDGDGKADAAVFRPSNGTWYLNQTTNGQQVVSFGANGDRPLPSRFAP